MPWHRAHSGALGHHTRRGRAVRAAVANFRADPIEHERKFVACRGRMSRESALYPERIACAWEEEAWKWLALSLFFFLMSYLFDIEIWA